MVTELDNFLKGELCVQLTAQMLRVVKLKSRGKYMYISEVGYKYRIFFFRCLWCNICVVTTHITPPFFSFYCLASVTKFLLVIYICFLYNKEETYHSIKMVSINAFPIVHIIRGVMFTRSSNFQTIFIAIISFL